MKFLSHSNYNELDFQPARWSWPEFLRLHPQVYLFVIVVMVYSYIRLPEGGNDWRNYFAIAGQHWWPNPYQNVGSFPYPPWIALLLSPLATLPNQIASMLTNGFSVLVLANISKRFGGPSWLAIPVMLTPAGFWYVINGQADWLAWLGLLFFNGFDVVFLAIKPHDVFGVVLPRLKRAGSRWWLYLLPAVVVGLVSLIVWWLWPVQALGKPFFQEEHNISIWPWGLPIAAVCLWLAWRTGQDWLGVVASPFLSPYMALHNYLAMFMVLAARFPKAATVIWIVLWVFAILYIVFFVHSPVSV